MQSYLLDTTRMQKLNKEGDCMKFKIKHGRHLANEGEVYNTTITEKKLNGYKVMNPEGNETFICFDDITVLELTEEEKALSITL